MQRLLLLLPLLPPLLLLLLFLLTLVLWLLAPAAAAAAVLRGCLVAVAVAVAAVAVSVGLPKILFRGGGGGLEPLFQTPPGGGLQGLALFFLFSCTLHDKTTVTVTVTVSLQGGALPMVVSRSNTPSPCNSYAKVPNSYGPCAYCSLDKAVDASLKKRRLHGELVPERGILCTNIPKVRAV